MFPLVLIFKICENDTVQNGMQQMSNITSLARGSKGNLPLTRARFKGKRQGCALANIISNTHWAHSKGLETI